MDEKKSGKGFVIKDKRLFDNAGEVRSDEPPRPEPDLSDARFSGPEAESSPEADESATGDFFSAVNFYNFVLSLSTTAMFHFGDFPDPASQTTQRNLAAAKHTIDILGMLKVKTEGNLAEHEIKLLDGILYELKMRYVREKAGG